MKNLMFKIAHSMNIGTTYILKHVILEQFIYRPNIGKILKKYEIDNYTGTVQNYINS